VIVTDVDVLVAAAQTVASAAAAATAVDSALALVDVFLLPWSL
jgi:hypothetical protein